MINEPGPAIEAEAALPDLVKVNRTELADATGRSFASLEDVLAGAEDLLTNVRC